MNESEAKLSKAEQKAKIRERYRGIDQDSITVIPAKPKDNVFKSELDRRVAVYARVSTDDVNQTSSYELQKNHYEDFVNRHPGWKLVEIYADEGISGTSLLHRDSFVRMIADCKLGKIDLILTKSVSRFARNIVDCIHYVRELKSLTPKVGIIFETENIYTLDDNSEMQLAFMATMAQEESHTKSDIMNSSIEMRFRRGIFLTPVLLGYDHDANGNLIINEEEAKTVQLIFLMYLSGKNCAAIADTLTKLGRVTKIGNTVWSPGSVYGILRNERYAGDVLARKTFTPNFLNHKSIKNRQEKPQYYVNNHHEAIIARDDFVRVQRKMDYSKYGFQNVIPELKVVDQGALKGFVQINPCWMGFTEVEYLTACHSVLNDEDYLHPTIVLQREKGEFNLEEYEVARSQFVSNHRKISVTCGYMDVKFSSMALKEFEMEAFVELLFHPIYQNLVVRKTHKDNTHAVKWGTLREDTMVPRVIRGNSFMPIIYDICGWNRSYRYTLTGIAKEKDGEKVLLFFADEPEIRISREQYKYLKGQEAERGVTAYPEEWKEHFGDDVNTQEAKAQSSFRHDLEWETNHPGIISIKSDFEIQPKDDIEIRIQELMKDMRKEGQ